MGKKQRIKRDRAIDRLIELSGHANAVQIRAKAETMTEEEINGLIKYMEENLGPVAVKKSLIKGDYVTFPATEEPPETKLSLWERIKAGVFGHWKIQRWFKVYRWRRHWSARQGADWHQWSRVTLRRPKDETNKV